MGDKNNKRKRLDPTSTENFGSKKNKRDTSEKKIEKKKTEKKQVDEKKNGEKKNPLPRRPNNADQENQNGCRSHSLFLHSCNLVLELNSFAKQNSSKQKSKKNACLYTKCKLNFFQYIK